MPDQNETEQRLRLAQEECVKLREENARLRAMLTSRRIPTEGQQAELIAGAGPIGEITEASSPEKKIGLFRSLFRGREDVYAVRWEGKNGKSGYSPAGIIDWRAVHAAKREEKRKVAHKTRLLLPLTDEVVRNHLTGRQTIGIYPLLPDATCWFLVVDFDKQCWMADAAAFVATCRRFQIPVSLERSRSGNGGHVWLFFDRAVHASDARRLGCALLTRTMEMRHEIGLDSYDRLFPSQDTMPKGGFGNLIALPLQKRPREHGNSVFLDDSFQPYAEQWRFLGAVQRIPADTLACLIHEVVPEGDAVGVHLSLPDEQEGEAPWLWSPSRKRKERPIVGALPSTVRLVLSNFVYVEKRDLPSAMLDRLMRIAAFQNPEFYRAQAMRLSTYGKPRVISWGESFSGTYWPSSGMSGRDRRSIPGTRTKSGSPR